MGKGNFLLFRAPVCRAFSASAVGSRGRGGNPIAFISRQMIARRLNARAA